MTGANAPGAAGASQGDPERNRRKRLAFRALIDEMMQQLREVSGREQWTPEERARAQADLERIMASVRAEALRTPEEQRQAT